MTRCIVCRSRSEDDEGHEASEGWLVCDRAWNRMAAALRAIPDLVVELSGLGFVERDTGLRVVRPPECANTRIEDVSERRGRRAFVAYDIATRRRHFVYEDGPADPVSSVLPSGPLNSSKGAPRVSGSPDARVPIRIDSTDLLSSARVFRLAGRPETSKPKEPCRFCREHHLPDLHAPAAAEVPLDRYVDQIGHLSVATELEFWARDWADARRERVPLPTVPLLAAWLLDRLDWACAHHMALDEFAEKLRTMRNSLTAAAGRFDAPVETLSAPCPECHTLSLYRDTDIERMACGSCSMLFTEESYADYVQELIKENPS